MTQSMTQSTTHKGSVGSVGETIANMYRQRDANGWQYGRSFDHCTDDIWQVGDTVRERRWVRTRSRELPKFKAMVQLTMAAIKLGDPIFMNGENSRWARGELGGTEGEWFNGEFYELTREELDEMSRQEESMDGEEEDEEEDGHQDTRASTDTERGRKHSRWAMPVITLSKGDEEVPEEVPPWRQGRKMAEGELEAMLGPPPFEGYAIRDGDGKEVALFKGLLCVRQNKQEAIDQPLLDLDKFQKQVMYEVRLYTLTGNGLAPRDNSNTNDPYLSVSIGSDVRSTRDRVQMHVASECDFFETFIFQIMMPGASELQVDVMDWDLAFTDDVVGGTSIDLEDRLFSAAWAALGPKKPVEIRALHSPTMSHHQGFLSLWVDILNLYEARNMPLANITPTPPQNWEMRLVIWRTHAGPGNYEWGTPPGGNDLYVKAWTEETPRLKANTDTHYKCRNGNAAFNWRLKFDTRMPCKHQRLRLQLWEQDLMGSADSCLAEASFDFTKFAAQAMLAQKPLWYSNKALEPLPFTNKMQEKAIKQDKRRGRRRGTGPRFKFVGRAVHDAVEAAEHAKAEAELKNMENVKRVWVPMMSMKTVARSSSNPDSTAQLLRMKADKKALDHHPRSETAMIRQVVAYIQISVQMMHEDTAQKYAAGTGRSEPNQHPTLPKPMGRMSPLLMAGPDIQKAIMENINALRISEFSGCIFAFCILQCLIIFIPSLIASSLVFNLEGERPIRDVVKKDILQDKKL